MNEFIRKLLINRINKALSDSALAREIEHPGLIGELREILLRRLIAPLLNSNFSCGSNGNVIDYKGTLSKETDICIFSKNLLPSFFFAEKKEVAIYPVESVMSCIEVKSTLNKRTLQDAYDKFCTLENDLVLTPGFHNEAQYPVPHVFIKPKYSVFAFDASMKNYSPESIFDLYKKIDPNWDSDPLITSICIANKGWACSATNGWFHMSFNKETNINEEIIGFLCALTHDLPRVEATRGIPRIGYYLTDTQEMDTIKNGKVFKRNSNTRFIFSNTYLGDL